MKRFNISVLVGYNHYMVDIRGKVDAIKRLINRGSYFTICCARRYGKTTTINELCLRLVSEYFYLWINFEGLSDADFSSEQAFCRAFMEKVQKALG